MAFGVYFTGLLWKLSAGSRPDSLKEARAYVHVHVWVYQCIMYHVYIYIDFLKQKLLVHSHLPGYLDTGMRGNKTARETFLAPPRSPFPLPLPALPDNLCKKIVRTYMSNCMYVDVNAQPNKSCLQV
ncbi:hypothetical protein EJ05DRAFT_178317 [Pseudovirgaria hyperparasitica]|uniref:Uncharacterized protein n=1 Tax=Pseudovirgaria hyperparasitica TaxID=470096 RepID=A0A6A6WFT1_9PEZI|nr:uncharacterized protein EJ05DRAFT_178317 [Pseudovirgaria hyperparasitica]KAF2761603.1 hypothetical protein EJ05DRAFT_178317 [Pseudovirgaria hyperparasitica]